MTAVRVPGKVMLSGEYAVLSGGAAALLPAPRYLTLSDEGDLAFYELPGVLRDVLQHPVDELKEYERAHPIKGVGMENRGFFAAGKSGKETLGIGLSSAEAAGAMLLRFSRAGFDLRERTDEIVRLAIEAHHASQGGLGSGADVAACVYSSTILFTPGEDGPSIKNLRLNPALNLSLLWTGVSSDTRGAVRKYKDWESTAGQRAKEFAEAADELAPLWGQDDPGRLHAALDRFEMLRDEMAEEAGIQLKLPINRQVEQRAIELGGRAKPVGAGGGDVILLIGEFPTGAFEGEVIPLT